MMLKEAFNWIADKAALKTIEVRGSEFTAERLHQVRVDVPRVEELQINSLRGLVDYIKEETESFSEKSFVHISTPTCVRFIAPFFGEMRAREVYVKATSNQSPLNLGWLSTEEMIIQLVTKFREDEDQKNLIKLLSSLVGTTTVQKSDDGLSQQVEVRDGITTTAKVEIKPIRRLHPIRTFSEIEPCSEMFLLRLRKNGAEFSAQLTEADGHKWEEEARMRISEFITAQLPDVKIIF